VLLDEDIRWRWQACSLDVLYAYRKLDPHVLVMQSTKDHAGKYATNGPDGAPISLSAVLSLNHNNFG
jgi:hypothetical protein